MKYISKAYTTHTSICVYRIIVYTNYDVKQTKLLEETENQFYAH